MAKGLPLLILLIITTFYFSEDSKASHIMGGDMRFECLGDGLYLMEMNLQYDCQGNIPPQAFISIQQESIDSNCTDDDNFSLTLIENREITPICEQQCSSCVDTCDFDIGIRHLTYADTIDMSDATCCNYEFELGGMVCCRNDKINNILNSANEAYHFPGILNICTSPCPNTPKFGREPVAVVCKDQLFSYNQAITAPAGDSLAFQMVEPQSPYGGIDYVQPFNADEPLSFDEAYGFNLDPNTGDLSFIPDSVMTAIMAIQIEQYRDDSIVSIVSRELQIDVVECDNDPPALEGEFKGSLVFEGNDVCVNDSVSIPVTLTDPDSNWVHIDWGEEIQNGSFTADSGYVTVTSHFEWSPGENDIGTHSFSVDGRDESCPLNREISSSVSIEVFPQPQDSIEGPEYVCSHTEHTYSATEEAGHTYAWSVEGGDIVNENNHEIAVQWDESGQGMINLTKTNTTLATDCSVSVTKDIFIEPRPLPQIEGPDNVCHYSGGYTYSTADAQGHYYNWSVSGGSIDEDNGNEIVVSWGEAGNGEITLTQTDSNLESNCQTTVTQGVNINSPPEPEISGSDAVCSFTENVNYQTDQLPGFEYQWDVTGGIITEDNDYEIDVTWGAPGDGQISLTLESDVCDTTVFRDVQIETTPLPEINGPETVCAHSSDHLYEVTGTDAENYVWSVNNGRITEDNGNEVKVEWHEEGQGSLILTQTDEETENNCENTVSLEVTVEPKADAVINGPNDVCAYSESITYTAPEGEHYAYEWDVSGGYIQNDNENQISVYWNEAGEGVVTVIVSNTATQLNCDSLYSRDITIHSVPDPAVTGPEAVCAYSANINYTADESNDYLYSWEISGGEIKEEQDNTINVNWGSAGTGEITHTQTETASGLECSSTLNVPITIMETPDVTLQQNANGPYCPDGNPDTLGGISVAQENGEGFWQGPGIRGNKLFDPERAGIGTHEINYIHTLDNGCRDTIHTEAEVLSIPSIPEMYNVTVTEDFQNVRARWYTYPEEEHFREYRLLREVTGERVDVAVATQDYRDTVYRDELITTNRGNVCYYVEAVDVCGRTSFRSNLGCIIQPEGIAENFINTFSWDPFQTWPVSTEKYRIGKKTDFLGAYIIDEIPYNEEVYADSIDRDDIHDEYCYYVEAVATDGRESRSKPVCLQHPAVAFIPNAFSPGVSPGLNDYFMPGGQFIERYKMKIFNRWGENIYKTEDSEPWDGKDPSGEFVEPDTYLYEIIVYGKDEEPEIFIGSVNVIR